MNPWAAVAGAGLGAQRAKNEQVDKNRQNRTEIAREMWSPWTGRRGQDQSPADYLGKMMQGALAAMAFEQQFGEQKEKQPSADEPGNMYLTQPIGGVNQAPASRAPADPMNMYQQMRSGNGGVGRV